MLPRQLIILILVMVVFTGCFFSMPKAARTTIPVGLGIPIGKIIDRDIFVKGGTLVILPFKAGEDAVANPQLDRISLMIAKGVIDYLNEQKTPFQVLTTQDQGDPQMMIEGYVEDFQRPGKLSRWILRRKNTTLRVSGQMVVVGTKDRVMMFQDEKSMPDPKADGLNIAYQTGQDLGRFIVDALNGG